MNERSRPAESALAWVRDCVDGGTVEKGDRLEQFAAYVAIPGLYPEATDIEWLGHGIDSLGAGQDRADIAYRLQGERQFVQCKNQVARFDEADAERYITAFKRRATVGGYTSLVVIAMGGFTDGAAVALDEVGATMIGPSDLVEVDIELHDYLALVAAAAPPAPVRTPRAPYVHNAEAIDAAVSFLADGAVRGQILRATGSGKTVVQAGIINALDPHSVLVAVPSIELTRQLIRRYAADTAGYRFLAVFSGRLPDDLAAIAGAVPATTDPGVVAEFLARPGRHIVVSTYQSIPDVIVAAADGHRFDLGLFDEAHRMATADESMFATALDDASVVITRRLFFTATPKITSTALRDKIDGLDEAFEVTIHSMDDRAVFGPEIPGTRLTLTEAIERDIVAPFDLIIGVIDDAMIHQTLVHQMNGRRQVNAYTDRFGDPDDRDTWVTTTDVAQAILFLTELTTGQSALTFHSSIDRARRMRDLLRALCVDLGIRAVVETVDGTSSLGKRRAAISLLADKDPDAIHIVTNCQLFTEGVDTPALDAVAFFDPKQSTIGVAQAIGRALRKAPDKARAKVIVPLFAADTDPAEFIRASRYGNLYTIAAALRDADVVLPEFIHEYRDFAAPITSHATAKQPGVYVTLPTAYDHLALRESIRSLVLLGTTSVALSEDEAWHLLDDYLALHGEINLRTVTSDEQFIIRQCERHLPAGKRFPDVIRAT